MSNASVPKKVATCVANRGRKLTPLGSPSSPPPTKSNSISPALSEVVCVSLRINNIAKKRNFIDDGARGMMFGALDGGEDGEHGHNGVGFVETSNVPA